ncbi:MAG: hypothetical protein U9P70_00555 [Patescibacteria group bacterium]|nr:hypothetical protein [Patescibacteria group bacterium]
MNTAKFLEETKEIENKLHQKASDEPEKVGFSILVKQLQNEGKIDKQIVTDLKKLWEIRNKVYSTPTPEDSISDEAQALLASLIGNPKLQ